MRDKLLRWWRDEALAARGTHIVCAVSGGADSVAMLHALHSLRDTLGITLSAAHYNHHLRGAESDRDEAFVRRLCQELAIPLAVSGGDVASAAQESGESIEEAARRMRYAFFRTLDGTVATAHTADDNLETVLLNLLRGTGLRGLCGIPPKRDGFIRPMLCLTRSEIDAYLLEHDLPHVEDSTNAQPDALRNRLRASVVPLLKQENPALCQTVLRQSQLLRQDEALLEQLAADALSAAALPDGGWSVSALRARPKPVRTRALRRLLRDIGTPKLTSRHIHLLERLLISDVPSARCDLPRGIQAARSYDRLTLSRPQARPAWTAVPLFDGCDISIPALGLRVRCRAEKNFQNFSEIQNSPSTFVYKCDMMDVDSTLCLRPRRPQDTIRLRGGTRSLKKLLIDRKIPAAERAFIPVLADRWGVIAVCGVALAYDRLAVRGDDVMIIKIEKEEKCRYD